MNPMIRQFIQLTVGALMTVLSKEVIQGFLGRGMDAIVVCAETTKTPCDDEVVKPAVMLVRAALEMPGDVDVENEMKKLLEAMSTGYKVFLDAGLDYVEDTVRDSKTQLDDLTVLPVCRMVRAVLNVPDNDFDVQPMR